MAYIGAGITRFNTADELTVTGDAQIDTTTLVVDSTNNRVGIGTGSPSQKLSVVESGGSARMELLSGTSGTSIIDMGDTSDADIGGIRYENTNNAMLFRANNDERMRIDSSGNLLVGKTSTGFGTAGGEIKSNGQITATASSAAAGQFNRLTSDGTILNFAKSGSTVGLISVYGADMFIGTDDAGLTFNNSADLIAPVNPTTGATRDGAIDLGASNARFKDGYFSGILYNTSLRGQNDTDTGIDVGDTTGSLSNTLTFLTGGSERMRVDSSGNVLVGKSVTTLNTTGLNVNGPDGRLEATASGNVSGIFNRTSSDGDIVSFRKDGTSVGSIGTLVGYLNIGTDDTGLLFQDDANFVGPWNSSTNAGRDAAIDLGTGSGGRFKDLYLSGGVYLGGTGSANHLDDYEEGLHVTTATPSGSGTVTLNSSYDTMAYTKIGRLVLITGEMSISSVSSPTGSVLDFTVPFACSSLTELSERAGGGVFWTENGVSLPFHVLPFLTFSGSIIRIFKDASAFSAGDSITFGVSYLTDS